jgi:putative DNA primase/helicase
MDFLDVDDLVEPTPDGETGAEVIWPERYFLSGNGFWYVRDEGLPVRLSGPFSVSGLARDPQGNGWAVALCWKDLDGVSHHAILSRADLIGDRVDVLRPLASGGLWLTASSSGLRRVKTALLGLQCSSRVRLVKRAGWYNSAFVLPFGTIGHSGNEQVVFDGSADAARYQTSGTLQEWIAGVAAPALGNSRLVFALSVGFAGPVNDLLEGEGGGFHFTGGSTIGKTTCLAVAGSIWGGGGRTGFVQTWRSTDNGLEGIARAHSGTLLALDELSELDPRIAGSTAYLLINGLAKNRATRDAEARPQADWRAMLLSAGEDSLADKIAEGGQKAKAGHLVRIADVPADAGAGFGLFENTKSYEPAAFAKRLKEMAARVYGTAGPAFVEAMAYDPSEVADKIRRRVEDIARHLLAHCQSPDGQLRRVAERFALVAASGELAREALELPWEVGEAERATLTCFAAWRSIRGGEGPAELVNAIEAVRSAVERHGESRFRRLDLLDEREIVVSNHLPIRDLLGYRFVHAGQVIYGFTASGWKEVLTGIGRSSDIAAMLDQEGLLLSNAKHHRFIKRIDSVSKALFAVRAEMLERVG